MWPIIKCNDQFEMNSNIIIMYMNGKNLVGTICVWIVSLIKKKIVVKNIFQYKKKKLSLKIGNVHE